MWYERAFLVCRSQVTESGNIHTARLIDKYRDESPFMVDFLQRVQKMTWDLKLLISDQKRWIGWAPVAADIEDIICVLHGCGVPVVLRRRTATMDQSYFELVGEAYVHGVTNGETIDSGYTEEEFEIY